MLGNKKILKGAFFVGLGAAMYGMLATFVKIAYNDGYTTAEVTTAQFTIGLFILFFLNRTRWIKDRVALKSFKKNDIYKLLITGTSYGCTSLFYYLSVQYIDVSIAIVLLMQSVWLSILLEAILNKKPPSLIKIVSTVIILLGTLLATNTIQYELNLDIRGVFWGSLAATSYTVTMFTSNRIANYLPSIQKSFIMLLGGAVVIFTFLIYTQFMPYYFGDVFSSSTESINKPENIILFKWDIFYTYGLFLAIFGTILPPILLNKGFPDAGLGVGSIVSSIELPVSVTMAMILLNEDVMIIQWLGIALIIGAIILMNIFEKRFTTIKND